MTYIAAFRGIDSVVMGADTQETQDAEKYIYCEKIKIIEKIKWGSVVVGGAGVGKLCDAFPMAMEDETKDFTPSSMEDVELELKRVLALFFREDVALEKPDARQLSLLIACGVPGAGVALWKAEGPRLLRVKDYDFVGYDSTVYRYFAKRLHAHPGYPSQTVLSIAYLLAIAKDTGDGVGGDSQIVTIREHGAYSEPKEYAESLAKRISEFGDALDPLMFMAMDFSIKDVDLRELIRQTENILFMLRRMHEAEVAKIIEDHVQDPAWRGDLYPKLPPDSILARGDEVIYPRVLGKEPFKLSKTEDDGRAKTTGTKRSTPRKSKRRR